MSETALWIARGVIVAGGIAGTAMLILGEDRLILIERRVGAWIKDLMRVLCMGLLLAAGAAKKLRHRLGRRLLRDCPRRAMTDARREEIALEWLKTSGFTVERRSPAPAGTSDEAWRTLIETIAEGRH